MSTTSVSTNSQLEAIYSMMESGQQSVRMERHTLMIWGITAAILILITDLLFNPDTFPVPWQQVTFQTTFISVILFIAGYQDFRLTRKLRQQRDESLSYIQLQLTKVWWFFIGLIIVLNVGMSFFGGGYMFYGLTMVLIGIALYIHGLFSTQMLKWIGMMLIIIGILPIAIKLNFFATKWLAAGVFGLGFPLLALVLDKPVSHSTVGKRLALSAAWFAFVIIPASLAYHINFSFDAGKLISTNTHQYKSLSADIALKKQIIHLPAGSIIPVNINFNSELVEFVQAPALTLKLKKRLDVVVEEGKATGHFKLDDTDWLTRKRNFRIQHFKMKPGIDQQAGAKVDISFDMVVK